MNDVIRLENVKKFFKNGQYALNDVSFRIFENEHVSFYGTPESGFNALIHLIGGLEAQSDGNVFILGRALHEMNSDEATTFRNRNIGLVPRSPNFMKSLSLLENVALPLTLRGLSSAKRLKAAKLQLKALGLLYAANAYPEQISAYEAQIASIARALIAHPKILVLEEITLGLSAKEAEKIFATIADVKKNGDYTILSFSGSKSDVLQADRYIEFNHGTIREVVL